MSFVICLYNAGTAIHLRHVNIKKIKKFDEFTRNLITANRGVNACSSEHNLISRLVALKRQNNQTPFLF